MNDQTATGTTPPVGTVCGKCGATYTADGWHNNGGEPVTPTIQPPIGTVCGKCGAIYTIDGWHNNGEPQPLAATLSLGVSTDSPDGWHNNGEPATATLEK